MRLFFNVGGSGGKNSPLTARRPKLPLIVVIQRERLHAHQTSPTIQGNATAGQPITIPIHTSFMSFVRHSSQNLLYIVGIRLQQIFGKECARIWRAPLSEQAGYNIPHYSYTYRRSTIERVSISKSQIRSWPLSVKCSSISFIRFVTK